MRRRRTLVTAALSAVALLVPTSAAVAGPSFSTSGIDGVWRSDGYGLVLTIAEGRVQFYETTAVSCAEGFSASQIGRAGPDGRVRFIDGASTFSALPERGGRRLTWHSDGSVGDMRLIRINAAPPACAQPGPQNRLAVFDVFWTTFAEHYPFFAAKGVDWHAVRDRYRRQVDEKMSDEELFRLLTDMIRPLGDAHTAIVMPGTETQPEKRYIGSRPGTVLPDKELVKRTKDFIEARDLGNEMKLEMHANGRIGYATLPGRLGYLRVTTFAGYHPDGTHEKNAEALDDALDAILLNRLRGQQALRGLILDLRVNSGGSDALAIQLAARLSGRPYLAYLKRARNDASEPRRFTTPQPVWVKPSSGADRYTGPLVLLTGGSTVSAGETFTQAMMQRRPQPVRIGAHTQGVFSDVQGRWLPNGWMFGLPNEEYLTPGGRTFDGPGIPPHISTPVFTDEEFITGRDSAFDRAVALLADADSTPDSLP